MIRFALGLALMGCTATPLAAQALSGDPRIAVIPWRAGETIDLRTAQGGALTVVFAPGERVIGFELADPAAFEVRLSPTADSLFVQTRAASTQPQLAVRTHLREYRFNLKVGPPEEAVYSVNFSYGAVSENVRQPPKPATAAAPGAVATYRLSGNRALRPVRIDDDGVRTFMVWHEEQDLPAVFSLSAHGEEEIVDGYMRDGVFTIDRVNQTLVFRIGKEKAKAVRRNAR